MKLLTGPEDVTTDWLNSVLEAAAVRKEAVVTQFRVTPLAEDKGFFGQIVRLHLTYDREAEAAPQRLIAKFSSANPEMRQRPGTRAAYEREVRFYRELAHRTSLPTPRCYFGEIERATGFHTLLLEDLTPAQNGSRVAGCTAEQARLAIREIARFHADWWESPALDTLDWLPNQLADGDALRRKHEEWWKAFLVQAGAELPDAVREVGEKLGFWRGAIANRLFHDAPCTLIHRDYHLDNMFFVSAPAQMPFAVVDWQAICRGRGMWDVGYFLCQNLEPEPRRAVEKKVVTEYHQTLCQGGVTNYSLSDCWDDYRFAILQRFGALISTIAVMPFTPEQRQMHVDILLPRNIAALRDWDAGAVLK
ncbi:MAG: hypothetical protein OHK0029_08440 [Armatimonadaceae bacterium]